MLQCGTDKQLKIELLSQWKLEAEFRKNGWVALSSLVRRFRFEMNNKTRVYIIKCEIICHSCCMMIIEHANLLGLVHFLKSDFDIDWLRSVTAWIFHSPPHPRTVEPAVTQHSLPPRRWRLERSFCQPSMISDRPIAPTRWSHLGRCKHKQMPSQL